MEDIVQTLIDLRLAYTGLMNVENQNKTSDGRYRRRRKTSRDGNNCDNNNNHLDASAVITIDEDALRSSLNRLSTSDLPSKHQQHLFDPHYLRLNNRR